MSYDPEAIYQDADIEQAGLAAAANVIARAESKGRPYNPTTDRGIIKDAVESAYWDRSVMVAAAEAFQDYGIAFDRAAQDAVFSVSQAFARELERED